MQHLTVVLSQRRTWLALTAAIALSVPAWAQERPPIRRATLYTIKADRLGEFEAAVKQYNEVYAKIPGARSNGSFQSLTGPRQFLHAFDYARWDDLNRGPLSKAVSESAELSRIALRINECVESSTTLVEELLPELSTPLPAEKPALIRVSRSLIRSDKTKEFEDIIKNELLPAYKKAGKTLTVRRVRFGAPTSEYFMSTRMSSWGDMENNAIEQAMGADAYNRMVAKLTPITIERELNVVVFRDDLSFRAPSAGAPPNQTSSR